MFTTLFWKDAAERFVWTFVQAILGLMVASGTFDVLTFDWASALTVGVSAAVFALVKAVVAAKVVNNSVSPASTVTDNTL